MIVKEAEFKGHAMIEFWEDESAEKPTLSFGLRKARIIVENIDAIESFVEKNQQGQEEN